MTHTTIRRAAAAELAAARRGLALALLHRRGILAARRRMTAAEFSWDALSVADFSLMGVPA